MRLRADSHLPHAEHPRRCRDVSHAGMSLPAKLLTELPNSGACGLSRCTRARLQANRDASFALRARTGPSACCREHAPLVPAFTWNGRAVDGTHPLFPVHDTTWCVVRGGDVLGFRTDVVDHFAISRCRSSHVVLLCAPPPCGEARVDDLSLQGRQRPRMGGIEVGGVGKRPNESLFARRARDLAFDRER